MTLNSVFLRHASFSVLDFLTLHGINNMPYTQNVGQNKFICTSNCELSREKCSPMAAFSVLVSKARTNLYILHRGPGGSMS